MGLLCAPSLSPAGGPLQQCTEPTSAWRWGSLLPPACLHCGLWALWAAMFSCLTPLEIDLARSSFDSLDTRRNGSLPSFETRQAFSLLKSVCKSIRSDEVLENEMALLAGAAEVDFDEFLKLAEAGKLAGARAREHEDELKHAFIAMGGSEDCTGLIDTKRLKKVVKDFGLTIDIGEENDAMSFQEFCSMLS
eukprot:gnl/Hemi2/20470_TR6795_c0_g1_i1.p1 gnl/Hemi2/20470_TR6795_c0_g1~~gnl/Hemi2/20470_TR6795_c0_g1_i1.p1  ORF type:complete len:192 (+),score=59.50 gnl/Hemi2/20470_TR6795_c0_g1_i1:35-610(+)